MILKNGITYNLWLI